VRALRASASRRHVESMRIKSAAGVAALSLGASPSPSHPRGDDQTYRRTAPTLDGVACKSPSMSEQSARPTRTMAYGPDAAQPPKGHSPARNSETATPRHVSIATAAGRDVSRASRNLGAISGKGNVGRVKERNQAHPQTPGFERDKRSLAGSLEAVATSSFHVSGGFPRFNIFRNTRYASLALS
jgi:hypothetical protein